jgi:hypothetical protein
MSLVCYSPSPPPQPSRSPNSTHQELRHDSHVLNLNESMDGILCRCHLHGCWLLRPRALLLHDGTGQPQRLQ